MRVVLTNAQMRNADSYTINTLKISSEELMAQAGKAIAEEVERRAKELGAHKIVIVCGTGNNGGDGYVAARELKNKFDVAVWAAEGNISPDCAREKSRYGGAYCSEIFAPVVVDCLFGTGLSRPVEGALGEAINKINSSGAYVIAADIPSGLSGDDGLIKGCAVKADVTVAIAELKTGYFLNDGPDFCGEVVKRDIGISLPDDSYCNLFDDGDFEGVFARRKRNSNKGTFGTANIVAGSEKYAGAAALAISCALKSGCGYVKLTAPQSVKNALVAKYPQVIYCDESDFSADSVAAGMGLSAGEETYNKIRSLLDNYCGKLIIDADGLNALARFNKDAIRQRLGGAEVAITPHIKEFSRLTGLSVEEIAKNPIRYAKKFARENDCIVLLKSSVSVLTDDDRCTLLHRGNSALAKGGSGDMLSGFAAGTAARGIDLFMAIAAASYVLGTTAEICAEERTEFCVTSRDIIKNVHFAVKRLTTKK